ncbi:MAG TPA: hypothetical protein VEF72_21345 [Mycobacterium sp.]|nr:hypothetical protein [Mycobacterium sp.]
MSTPRLEDLDPQSQARIRDIVAKAPLLTDGQRSQLRLLFQPFEATA